MCKQERPSIWAKKFSFHTQNYKLPDIISILGPITFMNMLHANTEELTF